MSWNTHETGGGSNSVVADVIHNGFGNSGFHHRGIVGLQEVCFGTLEGIAETDLANDRRYGRPWHWRDSDPYGDFHGILGRPCANGNAILAHAPVLAPGGDEEAGRVPYRVQAPTENNETRNYVRADIVLGPTTVRVYSTHITSKSDRADCPRRRSVKACQIRQLVSDIRAETFRGPRIVIGDFNLPPQDRGMRPMYAHFRDVLPGRVGGTAMPRGTTIDCPTHRQRIDYIFVSGGIQVRSARVARLRATNNPSDHCPVIATLSIPR